MSFEKDEIERRASLLRCAREKRGKRLEIRIVPTKGVDAPLRPRKTRI
jgi:hypothetical protein